MSDQLQELIAKSSLVAFNSGVRHERDRIVELLAQLICPDCQHNTCRDLVSLVRDITRKINAS